MNSLMKLDVRVLVDLKKEGLNCNVIRDEDDTK